MYIQCCVDAPVCQDWPCPNTEVTHTYHGIAKQDRCSIIQPFNNDRLVNTAVQDDGGLENNVGYKGKLDYIHMRLHFV